MMIGVEKIVTSQQSASVRIHCYELIYFWDNVRFNWSWVWLQRDYNIHNYGWIAKPCLVI